jgi:hypothetical protein
MSKHIKVSPFGPSPKEYAQIKAEEDARTYYAITWNLDVVYLGKFDSFNEADEYAKAFVKIEVMYIALKESLLHLKKSIEENI